MSKDLSDLSQWFTWTGGKLAGSGTGQPAFPCLYNDGVGDYQRHATHRTFSSPLIVNGWFQWLDNRDKNYPHAGIGIGLTQDNDHGYHVIAKANGKLQLLVERDINSPEKASDYSRLTNDLDHHIRPGDGLRHQFSIEFGPYSISARIDNQEIYEDSGAHQAKGWPRYLSGRLGLRLDRQRVKLGSIVVTELS